MNAPATDDESSPRLIVRLILKKIKRTPARRSTCKPPPAYLFT